MSDFIIDEINVSIDYFIHRKSWAGWVMAERTTVFTELLYIASGGAVYYINGETYELCAGDLLCVPKGTVQYGVSNPDDPMECYALDVYIYDKAGDEISLPFPLLSHVGVKQGLTSMYEDFNAAWLVKEPGYGLRCRAISMMIISRYYQLICCSEHGFNYDRRVKQAMVYALDHFGDSTISVGTVSEHVGLSPLHFGRIFIQSTGQTFRTYLNTVRLQRAEDMLKHGKFKVGEIADFCGFSDVFYFSKLFKKKYGYSPSAVIGTSKKGS